MKLFITGLTSLCLLTACSQADTSTVKSVATVKTAAEPVQKSVQSSQNNSFDYILMEDFSQEMASFVGLVPGESFAESQAKINNVFKSYEGHAEPVDISLVETAVEADWKQVLVTQEGLMDGAVAAQQLLAIFDNENTFISAGMRIKCEVEGGAPNWQNTGC